jgi:ABC-type glutathione transport system ATPase component
MAGTAPEPLLAIRGLRKSYQPRRGEVVRAVVDVNVEVAPGEAVGLVGASGAGKSATAKCVLQLERADGGSVFFRGMDLRTLRGKRLRRHRNGMQVVFQDPISSLDPRWGIYRIVSEPLQSHRLHPDEVRLRVRDTLRLVGLEHEADRRPHELSGGQAQRAAIARAVVGRPQLLICDEATSALDVSIQAQIINLLKDLQQRLDLAMLFISHDLGVVRALCARVYVMQDGRIVERGTTQQVLDQPASEYTQQLVAAASRRW